MSDHGALLNDIAASCALLREAVKHYKDDKATEVANVLQSLLQHRQLVFDQPSAEGPSASDLQNARDVSERGKRLSLAYLHDLGWK